MTRVRMRVAQAVCAVAGLALCGWWGVSQLRIVSAAAASIPVRAGTRSPDAPVARIEVPAIQLTTVVFEGVEDSVLARGSGHFPGTARPGGLGNFAVTGHRDTVFRKLSGITAGMEIVVTAPGGRYLYRVRRFEVVTPERVQVLNAGSRASMTLITCYPFHYIGAAPKRFCVEADLVGQIEDDIE